MGRNLHWTQAQYDDYCRRHNNTPQRNTDSAPIVEQPPKRTGRVPNKTEAAFGLILEARKRKGEILFYAYEGLSLRWGDTMRYSPDWVIFVDDKPITLVEVKGGHIWDRDIVRFKGCKAQWKDYFDFELHQRRNGSWTRLL